MKRRSLLIVVCVSVLVGIMLGRAIPKRSDTDKDAQRQNTVRSASGVVADPSVSSAREVLPGHTRRQRPSLPAPKVQALPPEPTPQPGPSIRDILAGNATNAPSLEKVEAYLRESQRSAQSLLAAARITGNAELLREAMERFPNDPSVLLSTIQRSEDMSTEKRAALDALCEAAPDNALGYYLSALEHFRSGDSDAAVKDIWRSLDKPYMNDYFWESMLHREELYAATGFSRESAAVLAFSAMEIPHTMQMRDLSRQLLELQDQYAAAGDEQSSQSVAEIGVLLGTRMQDQLGGVLINDLIGRYIERESLQRIDPDAVLAESGQTVAERLAELERQKAAIAELTQGMDDDLFENDDRVLMNYIERVRLYGELDAMRWLQERQAGEQPAHSPTSD